MYHIGWLFRIPFSIVVSSQCGFLNVQVQIQCEERLQRIVGSRSTMQELWAKEQQEEQVLRDITGVQVQRYLHRGIVERKLLVCTVSDPVCS